MSIMQRRVAKLSLAKASCSPFIVSRDKGKESQLGAVFSAAINDETAASDAVTKSRQKKKKIAHNFCRNGTKTDWKWREISCNLEA